MSFEKFHREEDDGKGRKVRSNYFQTEFSITFNKRKDETSCSSSSSHSVPEEKIEENQHRKRNISVQAGRNIVGQEDTPKERKKWIRPPLVGQASTSTDVVIPAHQELQSDSEDEIIETSHPTAEPTAFSCRNDYRNRKDYITEKPPEGGTGDQAISPHIAAGEHVKSSSPTSSITSSRPLEWDSGADVGYYQFYSGQSKESELSTLERLALERGSASLLPRSDPEGTTCSSVKPNIIIGRPTAESTPVNTLSKKNDTVSEKEDYYPLFPEVVIEEHGQISNSDVDNNQLEMPVKKSTSLGAVAELKPDGRPATFPRSQSQSNLIFNINSHLQKMLANTKSNSSSSVATVVTSRKKSVRKSPDLEVSTGDRANSFEYLPGHVFENKNQEKSLVEGQDFKKDVERGVQLMTEFVKGSNANNTLLKKELLQRVVEGLISAEYLSDNDWLPGVKRCVTRRSHVRDISGESSTTENNAQQNSKRSDQVCSSESSVNASKPTSNSSQNTSETRTSESLPRNHQKINLNRPTKSSINTTVTESYSKKSAQSSEVSKSSSDWKAPVTRSEKLLEAKKIKGRAPLEANLLGYLRSERENQIDWIKKEINHLNNLKQLLEKHENLRKNFATLKKNKQRALSADIMKSTRHPRKRIEVSAPVQSEPVLRLNKNSNNKQKYEEMSESDYNSHNYDTDRGDGILRRHASTDTREWKVANGWKIPQKKQSLAYTIFFESEKEKENVNYEGRNENKIIESGPVADRDELMKISRHKIKEQFSKLSLQEELLSKRPDYIARAEGRRQIVAELTALRELRQQHKSNILAAAVCDSAQPVPPHPLALKRVVSQRAMRNLTTSQVTASF